MMNAPGTCCMTNEKSSAPASGWLGVLARPAPKISAAVAIAKAVSAVSLTVTG